MERLFFVLGAASALLAVAAGAFGAHALRDRLSPEALALYETGARYHFYHALALLAAAYSAARWPGGATAAAGWLFLGGTLLFSGSLYLLGLTGARWLGALTPFGGAAFLAGWAALSFAAWRGEQSRAAGRRVRRSGREPAGGSGMRPPTNRPDRASVGGSA